MSEGRTGCASPTFAPHRRPPATRPQTPPPALQAHHAPDTAPSRGVPRMASTCSRSPGPTPRDRMISMPCRGLCGTGWQQARKWGAILPHRESSTVGGLQRASTVTPSGLSPFWPCFSGCSARRSVGDERPRRSRPEHTRLVRDPRRGALGVVLGSRASRDAPRRLRGAQHQRAPG